MVQVKKRHKVLVLFDTAGTPPADQDFTKELKTDDWAAEAHVIDALKKLGHEVRTIGVWDEPGMIIDEIKANPPDVVFNLTEHFNAVSAYDRNVAGLLEMLGVPYTGSSPTGLTLCKNKGMAKEILTYHKIRVPNFAIFCSQRDDQATEPTDISIIHQTGRRRSLVRHCTGFVRRNRRSVRRANSFHP